MDIKRVFRKVSFVICFTISLSLIKTNYAFASNDYASKYDPRESNNVTEVKNQQSLGVCWSFAGIGALETYLMVNNYGNYDLSEEHLRWWATLNDDGYGWDRESYEGAPTQTAPGYFTSYVGGAKLDSDMPYECYTDAPKPGNMDTIKGLYNVTDLEYVDNDNDKVKEAVTKYGAVATTFYESSTYLNKTTAAYNCKSDDSYSANHNVIIVGWDDNYSRDNFKSNYKPDNNGAWLVKDSNGTSSGDAGYLWISYEDKYILDTSINKLNYVIRNVSETDDDTKVYQYDDYGATSNLALKVNDEKSMKMVYANVFDFKSDYNVLDKVMINTKSIGATYSLYYAYVVDGKPVINYDNMILLDSGVISFAGYMTFDINNITLPQGEGAIVVVLDGISQNSSVSLGCEKNLYYTDGTFAYKANASLGESYIYSEDKVMDINESFTDSPRSLSIKAITKESNDTSIASVKIGNSEYVSAINDDTINVDLPSIYNGSKIKFSVTANNESSKLFTDDDKDNNSYIINKEINISDNNVIEFTCTAADGSSKTYKVNINISKDEINSDSILNFLNSMNINEEKDVIKINKFYDSMTEDEKKKISDGELNKILDLRNTLALKFHESNKLTCSNLPWQVSLHAEILNNNNEKYKRISGLVNGHNIISLYDVSLYDNYTDLSYKISDEDILVSILLDKNYNADDISVIHENKDGGVDIVPFTIKDNKVIFKVNSFSAVGIIQKNKKMSTNDKENGNSDDNSNINIDIVDEDDIIYNNKNIKSSDELSSNVETADNIYNYSYFIMMLFSLGIAMFIHTDKIKIKKRRKNL